METYSLIQLRSKYADDLEELLQCPVCCENMVGPIPTCIKGHHLCTKCRCNLSNNLCPYCKSCFNDSRNYLAENLATKFDEIKISLIDPDNIINKKVLENKICVATQTEEIEKNVSDVSDNNNNDEFKLMLVKVNDKSKVIDYTIAPLTGKGDYPCRIGNCTKKIGHGRIIPHVRYCHEGCLIEEKVTNSKTYTNSWPIQFIRPYIFNKVIHIPHMGIFFLIININDEGDLYGSLQIANTVVNSKQFMYSLEVRLNNWNTSYKGNVLPSRAFKQKSHKSSLFIPSNYMLHCIKKKNYFQCQLTIHRLMPETSSTENDLNTTN